MQSSASFLLSGVYAGVMVLFSFAGEGGGRECSGG